MINFDEKMAALFSEDDRFDIDVDNGYEGEEEDIVDADVDDETDEIEDFEKKGTRDWTNLPNPKPGKTLNDLKKVKLPLENGWTEEEVIYALKPTLISAAAKYSTPNFSKDEVLLAGMGGIMNALRTDKGIAPFPSHAYKAIMVAAKRSAAGTRDFPTSNVSGIKPNEGGSTDFLKGSRATVSADAPVGDSEGGEKTFASLLSGDPTSGSKSAEEQYTTSKLLNRMFISPEIGLTNTERTIMRMTYGLDREGKYSTHGPRNTSELADVLGVSKVRISQIRKKSLEKIKRFMDESGISSVNDALDEFGLNKESRLIKIAAALVLESMRDILMTEMKLSNDYIDVPVDINLGGIVRHAIAKVNTQTMSIDDVVAEGNESILGKAGASDIDYINDNAKIMTSDSYFSETINTIIQVHAQPILAVINAKPSNSEEGVDDSN
jgi:hypothetical protein